MKSGAFREELRSSRLDVSKTTSSGMLYPLPSGSTSVSTEAVVAPAFHLILRISPLNEYIDPFRLSHSISALKLLRDTQIHITREK